MSKPDVMPSCWARETRGRVVIDGVVNVPVFCMNCGKLGGYSPEYMLDPGGGYVGWICQFPCAEKWSPLLGTMLVPDEVFAAAVEAAQVEQYGRVLTPEEQARSLDDPTSMLAKLAKDRMRIKARMG